MKQKEIDEENNNKNINTKKYEYIIENQEQKENPIENEDYAQEGEHGEEAKELEEEQIQEMKEGGEENIQ